MKYIAAFAAWVALIWFGGKKLFYVLQINMSPGAREMTMTATAIGLFVLCMGCAFLMDRRQAASLPVVRYNGPSKIDPNKWDFDPDTGEYYRVVFNDKQGGLVEKIPYSNRRVAWLKAIQRHRGMAPMAIIVGSISAALGLFALTSSATPEHGMTSATLGIGFFVSLIFAAVAIGNWALSASAVAKAKENVGPPPVPPPGREQVEEQMAYGNAGPASIQDIHDALSGNAPTPAAGRSAPRGPIYED